MHPLDPSAAPPASPQKRALHQNLVHCTLAREYVVCGCAYGSPYTVLCANLSESQSEPSMQCTLYVVHVRNQLLLLFRFRRSINVAQTAQFCSCGDCLVRTSASCFSFFGRAFSLPIPQLSLSFHHPLFKTSRYAEHSNSAALIAVVLYLCMRYPCCQICLHNYA